MAARREAASHAPINGNRAAPPKGGDGSTGAAGNVGGYNNFWLDRGDRAYTIVDGQKRDLDRHRSARRPRAAADAGGAAAAAPLARFARPTSDQRRESDDPGLRAGRRLRRSRARGRSASAACSASARRRGRRCCRTTSTTTSIRSCRRRTPSMILTEMVHDARIVRMNARASAADDPQMDGRFDRALGRRHAGGRHDELHRQDAVPRLDRRTCTSSSGSPASIANACCYRFTIEDPDDLDGPWTGEYTWPATDELHVRVRVPRRQLRAGQHPARRAAAREAEATRRRSRSRIEVAKRDASRECVSMKSAS